MWKVNDILSHFLSRAPWVNRRETVDRVITGNPARLVDRCLVTWMPSLAALRQAVTQGIPLVVCHEPVFYHHWDDHPEREAHADEKVRFIRRHDLTILRLHDTWDRWPGVGIPWAWARHLGFKGRPKKIGAAGYQHRYDIQPVRFDVFARRIGRRCARIGEPQVQVIGAGAQTVSKIGIGTGCGCGIQAYLAMGCDCSIVCDDGSCYWGGIQMAEDIGHPVIRVNHGTSEEPGMVSLARYLRQKMKGLRVVHRPHGSTFHLTD